MLEVLRLNYQARAAGLFCRILKRMGENWSGRQNSQRDQYVTQIVGRCHFL